MGGWMECSSQVLATHLQPSSAWSNQHVQRH
eukprot:CAMPEP_0181199182 /NCGR_PEP_ID=MMETSP1096-20121128/17035_1 /TAXON_ID=156174 ORGANISM="Chrysochromulina ericina, Strain CCMP281" /NCGR_SAMPLE_ID=MMETSP1096 /ASSEMBLY_ACC=CAM_ASM_000453 /LENGTH=30 /DNA_ID= /DNA_START= /DNA_END= /DNA_ORIENTATION=